MRHYCVVIVPKRYGKRGSEAETPLPEAPSSFPFHAVLSLCVPGNGPAYVNLKAGAWKRLAFCSTHSIGIPLSAPSR